MGLVVPVLGPDVTTSSVKQRPATVPRQLGSPRAVLKGFFEAMDGAEASEARLVQALDYLDKGQPEPDLWASQQSAVIEQAKKPVAGLLLQVTAPVQQLVDAAKQAQ